MKLLYLTLLNTVPTEEGQKRIDKALKKGRDTDSDFAKPGTGRWFEEMGISAPEDLEEEESEDFIDSDGYMTLPLEEVDYETLDLLLPVNSISTIQEDVLIGSILTTKVGDAYHIQETVEEVHWYIEHLKRKWYTKLIGYLKEKFTNKNKQLN